MEIHKLTSSRSFRIRSFCSAEEIRTYTFNPKFGSHAHYKSLFTKRESLEKHATVQDANVTLALDDNREIIGFGVLTYPESDERWAKLDSLVMMEVKAIEVSRDWRMRGAASAILEKLLSHPRIEEKIVYMVGYSWTWDLDGTRKSTQQYRGMLIGLFEPFGFIEYQTNEANICLKPENIFMGRIGHNVSKEVQKKFKWLRFGIYP
ncbi:MAG: GNAT family N-acetyltransferase [Desulfobacterales bacterium]|jgi:acetoin utilization protein AcuA